MTFYAAMDGIPLSSSASLCCLSPFTIMWQYYHRPPPHSSTPAKFCHCHHLPTCAICHRLPPLPLTDPDGGPKEEVNPFPDTDVHTQSYDKTTDKHYPNIQTSFVDANGVDDNHKTTTGPFGFNVAVKLISKDRQCLVRKETSAASDCTHNPISCAEGLSLSIWEKKSFSLEMIYNYDISNAFPQHYIFSTGGDTKGHPGVALYHEGLHLVAVVSTGPEYWMESAPGPVDNNTWDNIGVLWHATTGLEVLVNNKTVCHRKNPMDSPTTMTRLDPPETIIGCHRDSDNETYMGYTDAEFDELALWSRSLSDAEQIFLMGGFVGNAENVDMSEYAVLVSNADLTDPNQKNMALEMLSTIISSKAKESSSTSSNTTEEEDAAAAANFRQSVEMTWNFTRPKDVSTCLKGEQIDNSLIVAKLLSNFLTKDKESKWKTYETEVDHGAPLPLLHHVSSYLTEVARSAGCDENAKMKYSVTEKHVHMEINRRKVDEMKRYSTVFRAPSYSTTTKLGNKWGDSMEIVLVSTDVYTDPRCQDRTIGTVVAIFDKVDEKLTRPLKLNPETCNMKAPHDVDSRVMMVMIAPNVVLTPSEHVDPRSPRCNPDPNYLGVQFILVHKEQVVPRRKPLFHSDEIDTDLMTRYCVRWNPALGTKGAWDKIGCHVSASNSRYTRCICKETGVYAILAERMEPKYMTEYADWITYLVGALYVISTICLIIYILVVAFIGVLKEHFHLMGLCLAMSLLLGTVGMFATGINGVANDRHSCTAVGTVLHLAYLSAGAWVAMIAHAAFKCITSGIVDVQIKKYMYLTCGLTLVSVGATYTFFLHNLGDDPNCFISWYPNPKRIFFAPLIAFCAVALFCDCVIFFNLHTTALRNNPAIEYYCTFSVGSAIFTFYFTVTWIFGGLTFMRYDLGVDLFPIFQILNSLLGLVLMLCIGLGSSRFRMAVAGQAKYRREMFLNYTIWHNRGERKAQDCPANQATTPTPPTRPISRTFSADGARPRTTDSDFPSRPPSGGGPQMDKPC